MTKMTTATYCVPGTLLKNTCPLLTIVVVVVVVVVFRTGEISMSSSRMMTRG